MVKTPRARDSEHRSPSRRAFLRGSLATLAVVGFDLERRAWATEEDVARGRSWALADGFPDFDGEIVTDDAALDAAADDYGHIVSRRPVAVLRPGSIDDVVAMVRFARKHGIRVAARGQGHNTFGQMQVTDGVVIDMATLATIHEITGSSVAVDAGATWLALLEETVPQGLAPPTVTDYLGLSIGGTLSVGGVGSQSYRTGAQVDNVEELVVVTGRGHRVRCSRRRRPGLFLATLAGLGQFAIIVRVRLKLVPVQPMTRFYLASYDDLSVFLSDLRLLIADGRFDTVQGFAVPADGGGWGYSLEATRNFTPGSEPDDAALTGDLGFVPGELTAQDMPYFDYLNRLAPIVEFLIQIGVWFFPHPWINLFLPGDEIEDFIAETLAGITSADVGEGPVPIYPYRRESFDRPFLRVPDTDVFFLFALLRNAIPPTPERAAELVDANRQLFERAVDAGGFSYPVDSVPKTRADWRRHYGPLWPVFALAKRVFDPDEILTPGQGIFGDP